MFDPTVFDNLKVVVEGDLYDLDLNGTLHVVDRKDLIDLADMSRFFQMDVTINYNTVGQVMLSTNLEQLSGELLHKLKRPGCSVTVGFVRKLSTSASLDQTIVHWKKKLVSIWGEQWKMSFIFTKEYQVEKSRTLSVKISFDRMFYEDNVDDLRQLLIHIVNSLD